MLVNGGSIVSLSELNIVEGQTAIEAARSTTRAPLASGVFLDDARADVEGNQLYLNGHGGISVIGGASAGSIVDGNITDSIVPLGRDPLLRLLSDALPVSIGVPVEGEFTETFRRSPLTSGGRDGSRPGNFGWKCPWAPVLSSHRGQAGVRRNDPGGLSAGRRPDRDPSR